MPGYSKGKGGKVKAPSKPGSGSGKRPLPLKPLKPGSGKRPAIIKGTAKKYK